MNSPVSPADFAAHPLATGAAPAWASEWGEDARGVFAGLTVGGETQIMRWIQPGIFRMGSPDSEPERFDYEGPRHKVTISKGFWLADTACTQALWKAVTGDTPSRFKGDRRPVESVSWDDVQVFLERINAAAPGLNLTLPTEAQWEYACRAGTEAPFSFGGQIDPTLVNYNGNHPYADGPQGLYREETVEVGTLPPNPWGLHEMHGNVWEWCADLFHPSYRGAPKDGSAWIGGEDEGGARRVLRGGSWNDSARYCRSASRLWIGPVDRYSRIGFRCARVQEE